MNKPRYIIKKGSIFGQLTVLAKDIKKSSKNSYYICRCYCGKLKSIMRGNLISGNTVSCGCYQKKRAANLNKKGPIEMIGLQFDRLFVIERATNTTKGQARWRCRCSCGKITIVDGSSLRTGNTTSCGCKRTDTIRSKPSAAADLTNRRFGRLIVLSRGKNKGKKLQWNCVCDCGELTLKQGYLLTKGKIKSCGCLEHENRLKNCAKRNVKHGLHQHPLYRKLQTIIARCHRITSRDYPRYGAKGRKVCEEWRTFPEKFVEWCLKNGWKEGKNLSIDRINNNGDYTPENCQIISSIENTIKRFTDQAQGLILAGKTINILELSRAASIAPGTVKKLLINGYKRKSIIAYGRLEQYQKIAVGNSIKIGAPIQIFEAKRIKRKCISRDRQPGYTNYNGMMSRCYNTKNPAYKNYGKRGIKVCAAWKSNFKNFLKDMGPPPGFDFAIHRIDNDANYTPSNCEWITRTDNSKAMHRNKIQNKSK